MAKSDGVELLSAERREPGFEVKAMTALLFGSRERAERKAFLVGLLSGDAVFQEPHKDYFLLGDRRAMFARAFQKLRKVLELVEEHSLGPIEERMLKYYAGVAFISLHDNVFLPTLLGMSDDEQLAEWAPMALSYQWIGCYAQTEIAHGSNVRGLRTTCTYLQDSDQLEIHTPDLGAVKWWPGCMGIVSTHAIVYVFL
ncbi:MAG: hypothetical protein Q8P67_00725 [archaeon]|nr:hypothetical protein [archaeon]